MASADQLGEFALGILSLAAHSHVAGVPLAGDSVDVKLDAPAMPAATANMASAHGASLFLPNQISLLRCHPLPKSLTISASAAHSSPNSAAGTSGTPGRGRRFSAIVISSPGMPAISGGTTTGSTG